MPGEINKASPVARSGILIASDSNGVGLTGRSSGASPHGAAASTARNTGAEHRRELLRLAHERVDQRRQRVAVGHDQSDRVGDAGSTIGIERTVSVKPSTSASFAGMTLAHLPVRTWANSTMIESDSSVGADLGARLRAATAR